MGNKRKKTVEWKDTHTQPFFPVYNYSLSVRNRYVFFWTLGRNYRKMMNFAANFTAPNRICAVYVFGNIGKTETFKTYAEEKGLLALHLPDAQDAIDTELRFYEWLEKIESWGCRDGDGPNAIWVSDREKHIKAHNEGMDGLDKSIKEYEEGYRLWKTEHPAALAEINKAITAGYDCYGLIEGKLDASLNGHYAALENVAIKLYPFGIESDHPKEYAYKIAAARKLANSALTGEGADLLGIRLAGAMGQLSFLEVATTGASEAVNTLIAWCDEEMNRRGCFSICRAWELLRSPPFGAYPCNWYMWIFSCVLRKYVDGNYFTGDWIGSTCKIPKGGSGLESTISHAVTEDFKRSGDAIIFSQNAEQDEFMRLVWKLFDTDKPWCETTSGAISQARAWITDNIHHAPLAMVDTRFLEIFQTHNSRYWYSKGYEKEYLPWIRDNFDLLYAAIRNADEVLHERLANEYGQLRADLFFKYYYVKGGAVGWLHSEEMVMERVEKYMKIKNVCRECGRPLVLQGHKMKGHYEYFDGEEYKFTEKEIVGLNKKLLGRCQNEYFCVPCLCEMLEINVVSLHERLHRFKEQGCELF